MFRRINKKNRAKNKLTLSHKISLSLLLILGISLFYFVVLVSTKPISFPYLTQKVSKILKENFAEDVKVDKTFVSFTKNGNIKIVGTSIGIGYEVKNQQTGVLTKQTLVIPRIETEFSLLKMFILKFQPSKIRIVDPTISLNLENFSHNKIANTQDYGDISAITKFLHLMRKGDILVEKFEVINANLNIINDGKDNHIFIKQAKIRADASNKDLSIESQSLVIINKDQNLVNVAMECLFYKDSKMQCDANLKNFSPASIADFHHQLSDLDKIFVKLDGNFKFKINNKKIDNLEFNLGADKGSFNLPQYFSQKIDFTNFKIRGNYDHQIGLLNFGEIEGDFLSLNNLASGYSNPHFSMNLMISNLFRDDKKMDFYIRIQDVFDNELAKFWPVFLNQNNVRSWVIEHLNNGLIKNAYAKFTLTKDVDNQQFQLEDINSEIIFANMDLLYDKYFPKIANISGVAKFTKNNMAIEIASADVLQSKILQGSVKINNFEASPPILQISGKIEGDASDPLKHANYNSAFATEVEKYLHNQASGDFKIELLLKENPTLLDVAIDANLLAKKIKNDFLEGEILINSKKEFNSNEFLNNINLSKAEIKINEFDITKKPDIESNLKFTIKVDDNSLVSINNIDLYKVNEIQDKRKVKRVEYSYIKGHFDFLVDPFVFKNLKLLNQNFGNNNFALSYNFDQDKKNHKLAIKGSKFYAGGILQSKIFKSNNKNSNELMLNMQVAINLNRLELTRQKFLRSFNVFVNCNQGICPMFSMSANYHKLHTINLLATKKPKEEAIMIDGRITDIGYLAEGLELSNLIANGNAKINLKQKIVNKKLVIDGKIEIDDDITIYENETVKKLAKDNLYSQIKDSIFSSDKTTFDSMKIDFTFENPLMKINSLVANNLKIGITAKGEINFNNNYILLRGMIVPGYIVNSLFGIGKIPLLGQVFSGILTGGEGGGLFGIRYEYSRKANSKDAKFTTNKVSAFVPSTIQNLFND